MSCNDTNPCLQTPCCEETNPCYDNCGCLNPTTFECVSDPGTCAAMGVTSDMNGKQVMTQICTSVSQVQQDKGKVMIDADDTCPEYLEDKLEAGTNISFTETGTGCDRKIVIHAVEGGVPVDVNVKVSSDDTTSGYLDGKLQTGTYLTKTTLFPAGDEKLRLDVVPSTLISSDAGNQLTLGSDGALKTAYTAPTGTETKVIEGTGVTVTGQGSTADPYIISTNPSIQVVRSCFDSTWRNVTLLAIGNPNVVYLSGTPQYRYRFDGSVEFRGSVTFNVSYGAYSTSDRKYTVTIATIPTTCLTLGEQAGTADLKCITYIDTPAVLIDPVTQMYGYIIRKSTQNLILEFQSSFSSGTTKTVVVNFEGVISHPSI